jgi:hypothetical protein
MGAAKTALTLASASTSTAVTQHAEPGFLGHFDLLSLFCV